MEFNTVNYKVTIDRTISSGRLDAKYELHVNANGSLLKFGSFYSTRKAKKIALKAIKRHDKQIREGTIFGTVFGINGYYEEIIKDLKD